MPDGIRRQQRLHLHQHRPGSLQSSKHRAARDVAAPLGQEQRRRIGHLGQAAIGHFEHADLVGGAVTVLHRAQDAELVATVTFEIQHRVHHVLQHARTGDGAILGDMTHQHQREIPGLRELDEFETGRAHLGHGAWRAVDRVKPHGLD